MTFIAYEFLAKVRAGLQLCGIEDGEFQWLGSYAQWCQVEREEFDLIWGLK